MRSRPEGEDGWGTFRVVIYPCHLMEPGAFTLSGFPSLGHFMPRAPCLPSSFASITCQRRLAYSAALRPQFDPDKTHNDTHTTITTQKVKKFLIHFLPLYPRHSVPEVPERGRHTTGNFS